MTNKVCRYCNRPDDKGRAWCACGRPLVLSRNPEKYPQADVPPRGPR